MAGISREHLNRIEAGKVTLTEDMQDKLMEAVEKFNPDVPMFLLFDYVRIRFPTLDMITIHFYSYYISKQQADEINKILGKKRENSNG